MLTTRADRIGGGWSDRDDPRRNNFDVLRLGLAAAVVFSHSFPVVTADPWAEPLNALTRRQVSVGTVAVYAFFAVSGFLIAQSWARSRSFGDFLSKRARRLYPGFAAMTLACAFVVVPLATAAFPTPTVELLGKLAYRVLVLDGWDDPAAFAGHACAQVNASVWTIPYEFGCYLLLAGAAGAGLLARRWGAVAVFATAYGLAAWFKLAHCGPVWADLLPKGAAYHAGRVLGQPAAWPAFVTYFFAGVVFFRFRDRIPHSNRLAAACLAVLAGSAVTPHALLFALPLCGTYLLFWVALHPAVRLHGFGRGGDYSYGVYLYAFPIQQLVVRAIGGPAAADPMTVFAWSLPLSLVAGVLSWHLVEKRFLARRRAHAAAAAAAPAMAATARLMVVVEPPTPEDPPADLGLGGVQIMAIARGEAVLVDWQPRRPAPVPQLAAA